MGSITQWGLAAHSLGCRIAQGVRDFANTLGAHVVQTFASQKEWGMEHIRAEGLRGRAVDHVEGVLAVPLERPLAARQLNVIFQC
jgi:hypothetical protein